MKPGLLAVVLALLVVVQAAFVSVEHAMLLEQPRSDVGGEIGITPALTPLTRQGWRATAGFQSATGNATPTNASTQQTPVIVATPSDTVGHVEASSRYAPPLWWLALAVSLVIFVVLAGPMLIGGFMSRWKGRRERQP